MFVAKIVGTQGLFTTSQIEDYLRGMIISRLTDLIGETMGSIFDLPATFDELGAGIKAKVADDFAQLGILLKQMFLGSVSPTEETQKAIDERASMGAIGNMQAYMQYQAAKSMRDAASQPGGEGGASTGVGLGAGHRPGRGHGGHDQPGDAGRRASRCSRRPADRAPRQRRRGQRRGPEVMTLAEAAAYLKADAADVQALITSGQIKAKQIGTEYRISKKALDAFLSE